MLIEKPKIFYQFPNLIFGLSKKINTETDDKFCFNMSKLIGESEARVEKNRSIFFKKLGLTVNNVIIQKQIHSDIINIADKFTIGLTGDALITRTPNLGLAISTADCTNIYLFDKKEKVIAAVHSGWAGTEKRILEKTLQKLKEKFNSNPRNIYAYFGPSISQKNYEVGKEFDDKFDKKYLKKIGNRYLLDLKTANKDILTDFGVPENQIEVSEICSFEDSNFHSFRRDKKNSGRALGVIAVIEPYE